MPPAPGACGGHPPPSSFRQPVGFVINCAKVSIVDRSADWLKQAEKDLRAAEDSAQAGHHEWTAFQTQQSAEKAVKALVQFLHGSARGRSVTAIVQQLP